MLPSSPRTPEHPHQHRRPPRADRREPPLFSRFLRPDPGLELLILCLYPLQHLTDPLHVPVRLVRPSSRVVFASVILIVIKFMLTY